MVWVVVGGSLEGIGSDMSHGAVIRIGALVVSLAAALGAYALCDSYVDWLNDAHGAAAAAAGARSGGLVRLVATRMVFGASWVTANLILSFFAGILSDAADVMILLYCVDRDHKTVSKSAPPSFPPPPPHCNGIPSSVLRGEGTSGPVPTTGALPFLAQGTCRCRADTSAGRNGEELHEVLSSMQARAPLGRVCTRAARFCSRRLIGPHRSACITRPAC